MHPALHAQEYSDACRPTPNGNIGFRRYRLPLIMAILKAIVFAMSTALNREVWGEIKSGTSRYPDA